MAKESKEKTVIKAPKSKKGKRALEKKAGKQVENAKRLLLIPGHKVSQVVKDVLVDLSKLKGEDCKRFTRNNEILPFEAGADAKLQFFCDKNDCSLFVVGTHSKKRPNNIILGRTFEFRMLDMIEFGIEKYRAISEFGGQNDYMMGNKPCFTFAGQDFDTNPQFKAAKSLLLDTFRGQEVSKINLKGLDHLISCVAHEGKILLRHYVIHMKKSGSRVPRVELTECGPSMDLSIRRYQAAPEDLLKESLRTVLVKKKKEKNVRFEETQGKMGRLYMPRQEMDEIALKKSKGQKRKVPEAPEEGAAAEKAEKMERAERKKKRRGGALDVTALATNE